MTFIARCNETVSDEFNQLALGLFGFQFNQNKAFANLCRSEKNTPDSSDSLGVDPAVPTRAFKSFDITVLPEGRSANRFSLERNHHSNRSRHHHNAITLSVYKASLWNWFSEHMVDESVGRLLFLCPNPSEAPESSLCQMMGVVAKHLAKREHRFVADAQWRIDGPAAVDYLHDVATQNEPVTVLGTAFSFVHLLDFISLSRYRVSAPGWFRRDGNRRLQGAIARGSQTGVAQRTIAAGLGILPERILCEYGMCELSSQAYDGKLGQANPAPGCFVFRHGHVPVLCPRRHLTRSRLVRRGCWRSPILANVGSALCVLTEDLAKRTRMVSSCLAELNSASHEGVR